MKELLKNLIAAKSTADAGEIKCAKVLDEFFYSNGLESKIELWNKTRANITARIKSSGMKTNFKIW